MRTQRELLFDQNSPSTIIQEKSKQLKAQGSVTDSATTPEPAATQQQKSPEHQSQGKPKPKKKKKKTSSADDLEAVASSGGERLTTPVSSHDGKTEKGKKASKAKRKKTASAGTTKEGSQEKTPSRKGVSSDESLSPTESAGSGGKRRRRRKSQADETDGTEKAMAELIASSLKTEIDPSLKVKKSGVMIGPSSSRGNSRRPSLSLFDQSPTSGEDGDGRGDKVEVKASPVVDTGTQDPDHLLAHC